MRKRATITFGGVLAALFLALGPSASADVGVGVGPSRQYLDDKLTEIQVSNPTDQRVRVVGEPYAHTEAHGWQPAPHALGLSPERFVIPPRSQVTVLVSNPPSATAPCALYGAAFHAKVGTLQGGVVAVQGTALAQLVLRRANATEASCLAILPTPAPKPVPPFSLPRLPWLWLLFVACVLTVYGAGRYRRERA